MSKCWIGFDGYGIAGVDEEFVHFVFNVVVSMTKLSEDAEVGLVLCEDEFIQNLNKQYRQKDYVPNVLSFVYGEMEKEEFVGEDANYLGDIFIAKSLVEQGAKDLGVTPKDEFARLFVHGLLHVAGMEHEDEVQAETMEELEDKILAQILSVG